MNTLACLNELYNKKRISYQAFRTYRGQVMHGDEAACIVGLQRKHLIDNKGRIIDGKNIVTGTSRTDS